MLSLALLAAFGALAAAAPLDTRQAAAWPDPEPCSGNCTGVHDPSLLKAADGTWWLFSTNGDISIASAPAIGGPWTYQGAMLPGGSSIQVTDGQQIWAPDVSLLDGTYYAYYAVSTSGSQASDIGVATSTALSAGSWTDHGSIGIPKSSAYNLIDPNFFREAATDPIYFTFGSAWNGIFQTSLDGGYLAQASGASPANAIFNATIPAPQTYPAIVEGSFQFWWQVGAAKYYYLFFSSGACCNAAGALAAPGDEYKVMVCRSASPTGPWADANGVDCLTQNGGTLVLGTHGGNVYAPGGQGVYADSSLSAPVLYYHYVNPNIGYEYGQFQFGYNYLSFDSGWPVVVSS